MTITTYDPGAADPAELDAVLRAVHTTRVASSAIDMPHEPPDTYALWRAAMIAPWSGDRRLLLVARDAAGAVVGHTVVEFPQHDNLHVAMLEPHVVLEQRRHGIGRSLFDAAVATIRAEGRRTVLVEARLETPAMAFLAAAGAEQKLVEVQRVQDIAELDLARVAELRAAAERAATGYTLERWEGPAPEHLRADVARAVLSLNDAPIGGLDYDDEHWDANRVERRDRFVTESRLRLRSFLAYSPDREPAGYTEVAVGEDGTFGWQWGTGVSVSHRGHRLGVLLKASMVEWLRAAEPRLEQVSTWNADSNQHMIAINEALGYRVVDHWAEWQLDL